MIRILQSGWMAALLGGILYLATTIYVLSPSKFAGAQFIKPDYSAGDDPSWKFRNPEFNEWVSQVQSEKDKLDVRQQQLDEWQTRLNLELQEMSLVTLTVNQLQSNFDQSVIRFKAQEMDNIKHQAKLISAMSPQGAINMLNQMSDDDVVRILYIMKPDQASAILDAMSIASPMQAKRAASLTGRLHEVLPDATPTTASNAP
jgi:flagellar motility protein MotE (MotC chaperone)